MTTQDERMKAYWQDSVCLAYLRGHIDRDEALRQLMERVDLDRDAARLVLAKAALDY